MQKRLLMAEEWDKFARAVLPRDCPQIQKQEMRRAFYAGAQGILYAAMLAISPGDEPTEEDLQTMRNVRQELDDFCELVKSGRA